MLQSPAQDALITVRHGLRRAVKPASHASNGFVIEGDGWSFAAMGVNAGVMPDAGQHRVERETHKHRNQYSRDDGDAKFMEKLAHDTAHETDRQKHRHNGQCGGQHRQTDFFGAIHGRGEGRFAHLHMAHDVFPHHNGVVDQQAHAQAQRHHRDVVDGEAKHVHEQKRADDGDRQRQTGDDG